MKLWLHVFLSALFFSAVAAQAQLVWEKTEVELHPGPSDKQAVGTFRYENKTDKTIHIASVHTSCGCTTAGAKKNDVSPGEKGEITATFNIGDRTGVQQKQITVQTDDTKQPATVLTLKAVIASPLELQPTFVFWQQGEEPKPKTIIAKTTKEIPVKHIDVSSSSPEFQTSVEQGANGEFKINVTPHDTTRTVAATLTIKPDNPPKPYYAAARVMPTQAQPAPQTH
ncbi:MAG: DUF1573 domain-containing protein [Chthoniobacterales bacterium]